MSNNYQPTIGLEIHIELKTKSKMFCSCPTSGNSTPNTRICPICLGMPGTLPVPNKKAIEQTIMVGLALGAKIPTQSKFDRKHYFYPDLPKGYQISQYDQPLASGGWLEIKSKIKNQKSKKINIHRIHLEEDTGKLMHPAGADYSLVDYNRAGVPLMELVTEPDIDSAEEAKRFCQELQLIARYLGVSNADMEKGEMRCEVNISIIQNSKFKIHRARQLQAMALQAGNDNVKFKKNKTENLGTKVEVKNLNSFRAVERAINYEIERQAEALKSGGKIVQETRGWNENKGETFSQRAKEGAQDYRYFPEPDIPSLRLELKTQNLKLKTTIKNLKLRNDDRIDIYKIKRTIPELPQAKRDRFAKEYGLPEKDIEVLVANKRRAEKFDKIAKKAKNPKLIADWLVHRKAWHLTENDFLSLEDKISNKEISKNQAEEIIAKTKSGKTVEEVIISEGIKQIGDKNDLEKIIKDVIIKNVDIVDKIKKGKTAAKGFLVGEIMRETRGQANPRLANEILEKILNLKTKI